MNSLLINLYNWRSYKHHKISLPLSSFSLIDNNGSGKTSLISAWYSLLTGKAWPTTSLNQHLSTQQNYFGLQTMFSDWYLNGQIGPSGRLGTVYERPKHILDLHNLQLDPQTWPIIQTYTPTDNLWLSQSRINKLQRLDQLIISRLGQGYDKSLKDLNKLVKQKQAMLKKELDTPNTVDPILVKTISHEIAIQSHLIWTHRQAFLQLINRQIPKFRTWIHTAVPRLQIRWSLTLKDTRKTDLIIDDLSPDMSFIPDWQELWNKELIVGRVLYGAQRDDFVIESDHRDVVNIFSRGEMRLFVLFLFSLGTADIDQDKPIFWLLDDVFNELDSHREKIIYDQILSKSSFFMATGTKPPHLPTDIFTLSELTTN